LRESNNLTMLTDFYEFTMTNGLLQYGMGEKIVCFDMFFRTVPDDGGYAIMAGVEDLVDYMNHLSFSKDDIDYLRSKEIFSEEFLDYLAHFKFSCDVWAVPEGTPIFPGEPIVTVRGPVMEAQLLETMVLLTINHQSLIATKANRIVRAANGRPVMEFGSRRAQGYDAAVSGARAAFIAGCSGTACSMTDELYGVSALGTMAHSWVQMFDSEYESFRVYAKTYPHNCVLLIDTYNVLKSGLPNAIRVFRDVLLPMGIENMGIRIDSGDITYLTKKCREILYKEGFPQCQICISNSLDEYIIQDTLMQGAEIDSFGVGERLITSKSEPVFGGVYKLCAVENGEGQLVPRIKVSENVEKITNPGFKTVYRLFSKENDKAIADVITLHGETICEEEPYMIFDPNHMWKRKIITNFTAKPLLERLFDKGNCVYEKRDIHDIRAYCKEQMNTLWSEVCRFENPHRYYVDLSQKLWDLKDNMLKKYAGE